MKSILWAMIILNLVLLVLEWNTEARSARFNALIGWCSAILLEGEINDD